LHGQQQPGVIPSTRPGVWIWSREQGVDFLPAQIRDVLLGVAFTRNGKHPLDGVGPLGQLEGGIAEEGANGCQTLILTACATPSLRLQIVQEATDQLGIEVIPAQVGRFLSELHFGKLEQQAKAIAVGTDRMGLA
jgi:hypothetical protein